MPEEIPPYFCKRLQSLVYAEDLRDIINEKVFVVCKKYDSGSFGINKFPCIFYSPIKSKCLIELRVKRMAKKKLELIQ
jgi:hypothetical protein